MTSEFFDESLFEQFGDDLGFSSSQTSTSKFFNKFRTNGFSPINFSTTPKKDASLSLGCSGLLGVKGRIVNLKI
jgi:hypothetical protein